MLCTSILPPELHRAIIKNNPDAIVANLQGFGVSASADAPTEQILSAIYALEAKTNDFSEYVNIVRAIFDVPINPEGEDAATLQHFAGNNLGAMVVCNALSYPSEEHKLVTEKEYKSLRFWAFLGVILTIAAAIYFITKIYKRQ